MIAVGVTATRQGLTDLQKAFARGFLRNGVWLLRHGDCKGGDADLHDLAVELGIDIRIHPGLSPIWRAHKSAPIIEAPIPELQRNHVIVNSCDVLLGFPKSIREEPRGGTWTTIRYARNIERRGLIVWPDGLAIPIVDYFESARPHR